MLSRLEKEVLEDVLNNKIEGTKNNPMDHPTVAYAVWTDEREEIQFGRVRRGYRNNYHTEEGSCDSISCSPFPGAWVMVPVHRILRISHVRSF